MLLCKVIHVWEALRKSVAVTYLEDRCYHFHSRLHEKGCSVVASRRPYGETRPLAPPDYAPDAMYHLRVVLSNECAHMSHVREALQENVLI